VKLGPVLAFLGRLTALLASAMLLPAICALIFKERDAAVAFLISAICTGAAGLILIWLGRQEGELYRRAGVMIVVGGWLLASLFGALPYLLSGSISHPVDALFESASGFTTTGSTILLDIEALDRSVLFWRSFTQWLGGMGIIVLFVALLQELGVGARFVYKLEVPGPTAETLHPRVHDTAKLLWWIYLGLTVVEVVALMLAGLGLFDALTHTFSTLSTGGFSPRNASIGAFDSVAVEIIIIFFMLVAGANFSLYYGLGTKGLRSGFRSLFRDYELRVFALLIACLTVVVCSNLLLHGGSGGGPFRSLLDSVFQTVAILTGTGFGTADFDSWPNLSRVLLVAIMFVGACAGSTSGGMKIIRLVIGFKSAFREVRLMFSPNSVLAVLVGRRAVPNSVVSSVVSFIFLFVTIWVLGTLALTVGGTDLETSASAAIAVLGNIGPGLGAVGSTGNYAFFDAWQKIVMIVMMWLGRLEVYPIAAVVAATFWRR